MVGVEQRSGRRTQAVQTYEGHSVHAAPGVHEYAVELARAALPVGGRVLEVGAGCGALAVRLREAGFDVVPTDLDPPHDWIHRLDLDNPEWTDDTSGPFDMVVCVETLEHVENPRQVLRSIRALLRPGDRLLVSTPNVTHPHSRLKMFLRGAPYIFGPTHY
jgi:2-polyprenyl-3-methyl-5-hydroxy-6-metoxy-1,4-benzoquinol methylase